MHWIKLFVLISTFSGPGDTTKYYLYETENVNAYTQSFDFTYPAISKRYNQPVKPSSSQWMEESNPSGDTNKISITMPDRLQAWMNYLDSGDVNLKIPGFRVQVYAGSDLEEADRIKGEFLDYFSNSTADRIWDRPTFRVRAGNFVDRKDAKVFCNDVRRYFPGAFVVPDMIARPSFRPRQQISSQDTIATPPPGKGINNNSPR